MVDFSSFFPEEAETWSILESNIDRLPDPQSKGDAFEFVAYYYLNYNRDLYQIDQVYWPRVQGKSFPLAIRKRLKLERSDHGVDGVVVHVNGSCTAYQAKFRTLGSSITERELATFWSEAEYADLRCVVSNVLSLPNVSAKKMNSIAILRDKFEFLDSEFFSYLFRAVRGDSVPIERIVLQPRDYQQKIINEVCDEFRKNARGKLIAACGSGKTLISLWVTERLEAKNVLFLAPSLALVRQTLERWSKNSRQAFSYLCVCSDATVGDESGLDEIVVKPADMDVPVTTTSGEVTKFICGPSHYKYLFATYHSLGVIAGALRGMPEFSFDIIHFDEAHRTAGSSNSNFFSLGLDDSRIAGRRRLFMTATERLIRPWIRDRFASEGRLVFSMDDEELYGPVFSRLTFGEAIASRIISDYRIVLIGVSENQVFEHIATNRYLQTEDMDRVSALELAKAFSVGKVFSDLHSKKMVTFHSRIQQAQSFSDLLCNTFFQGVDDCVLATVTGSQNSAERQEIFRDFSNAGLGCISNVRCMSEGVDIPMIDSVFFAEPRASQIDIVQAVGRALRQPYGEQGKIALIVLPVFFPESPDVSEVLNSDQFETMHNVIQALRDQDEQMADWIDQVNLSAVSATGRPTARQNKMHIILPETIDQSSFSEAIYLRIADINRDPSGAVGLGSQLSRGERVSDYKRIFKTLGDYNPDTYLESLVAPTMDRFVSIDETYSRKELKVNHNNVSHTERIGLIEEVTKTKFALTALGRMYFNANLTFNDVFINQMMLYSVSDGEFTLFPYRSALEVLRIVGHINYVEFLYGVYSIQPAQSSHISEKEAVDRILRIRSRFPRPELTSQANRQMVLDDLNRLHPTGFSFRDVWTDRTTTGNQFRYFLNHLALFHELVVADIPSRHMAIKKGSESQISELLAKSDCRHAATEVYYGNHVWVIDWKKTL